MSEKAPFTIEQFYKNINQQELLAGKCIKCGRIHLPPRTVCDNCHSKDFEWTKIPRKGKLLTYTVIHIAPAQFQSISPYAIGIVQLENGVKLPGMIQDTELEQLKVGMPLSVEFGACEPSQPWPHWPRYYFKPT
jgi:scaffold protein (connect acetoacetyl-CoA thiolase and HMG-CoA synthase)